jgi:hypothetical protein
MLQARMFFDDILPAAVFTKRTTLTPFQITLGAKTGWRCVAKLAVRQQQQQQQQQPEGKGEGGGGTTHNYVLPAIGLFSPGEPTRYRDAQICTHPHH